MPTAHPPGLSVASSLDSDGRFRCVRLAATITPTTCRHRQCLAGVVAVPSGTNPLRLRVLANTHSTSFPSCRNCAQGRAIVAELGAATLGEVHAHNRERRDRLVRQTARAGLRLAIEHDARRTVARIAGGATR